MLMNYYNELRHDGLIYSVDMVRLKLKFSLLVSQEFMDKLSENELLIGEYDYYQSFKLWQYRHLFSIKMGESTSVLGLQLNDEKRIESIDGYLEFNPNKVGSSREFDKLYSLIREYADEIELKRWDLAIDIPCKRTDLVLSKDQRIYQYIESPGGVTEYLGRRSHDGFVKLYDKTRESNLDYDLTRLELTIGGLKLFSELNMPLVKKGISQLELRARMELSRTDLVIYKLMLPLSDSDKLKYLREMGKTKSVKLKPYLFVVDKAYEIPQRVYNDLIYTLRLYTKMKIK